MMPMFARFNRLIVVSCLPTWPIRSKFKGYSELRGQAYVANNFESGKYIISKETMKSDETFQETSAVAADGLRVSMSNESLPQCTNGQNNAHQISPANCQEKFNRQLQTDAVQQISQVVALLAVTYIIQESIVTIERNDRPPPPPRDRQARHDETRNNCNSTNSVSVDTPVHAQRPVGLVNLGNTCYFNAVMQNLYQTRMLRFLLAKPAVTSPESMTTRLITFYENMDRYRDKHRKNSAKNIGSTRLLSRPLNPHDLLIKLRHLSALFTEREQHDSHDCLRHVLDAVKQEEEEEALRQCQLERPPSSSSDSDADRRLTVIDRVFGGNFLTIFQCHHCKMPYHLFELFLDLALPAKLSESVRNEIWPHRERGSNNVIAVGLDHRKAEDAVLFHASEFQQLTAHCPTSFENSSCKRGVKRPSAYREKLYWRQNTAGEDRNDKSGPYDRDIWSTCDEFVQGDDAHEHNSGSFVNDRLQNDLPALSKKLLYTRETTCSEDTAQGFPDYDENAETCSRQSNLKEDSPEVRDYKEAIRTMEKCLGTLDPDTVEPNSLQELLAWLTREEHLYQYMCAYCNKGQKTPVMRKGSKQTLIFSPPAVLTIYLKRFKETAHGYKKDSTKISFNQRLDLAPFCNERAMLQGEGGRIEYRLYGIVVHDGTMQFGHYTAYVRTGTEDVEATKHFLQKTFVDRASLADRGRFVDLVSTVPSYLHAGGRDEADSSSVSWWYVSDAFVRQTTVSEVLSQQAYILFYERII